MNFEHFVSKVSDSIKDYLSEEYEDAKIIIEEQKKLNNSYHGLTILKNNEKVAVTINLDQIYENYSKAPSRAITDILSEVAAIIMNSNGDIKTGNINFEELLDYAKVKEKLFIKVSSFEKNKDFLKDVPFVLKEDLAITFHIMMDIEDVGFASTIVKNDMMNNYGITKEQLYQDATYNSTVILPAKIESMDETLSKIMISEMREFGMTQDEIDERLECMGDKDASSSLLVVGNDKYIDGAAVIFYPGVLDQIGEKVRGNFYIIPSSIHECIIAPEDGLISAEEINDMIKEVNMSNVAPHERLSNQAYHYDIKEKIFEKAVTLERRHEEENTGEKTVGFATGLPVSAT